MEVPAVVTYAFDVSSCLPEFVQCECRLSIRSLNVRWANIFAFYLGSANADVELVDGGPIDAILSMQHQIYDRLSYFPASVISFRFRVSSNRPLMKYSYP